jgi:hypothetical protein
MGVCKQTVDGRGYRLDLCHLVYFLELGVDGQVTIHGLIRKFYRMGGGPLSVSDVGVPREAFCPAGRLRFVRQASNASTLSIAGSPTHW